MTRISNIGLPYIFSSGMLEDLRGQEVDGAA
jgi:hypothetical protein